MFFFCSKLLPILQHTAKIGNPKQAKHALRCINKIVKNKEPVFSQIFEVRLSFQDKIFLVKIQGYLMLIIPKY